MKKYQLATVSSPSIEFEVGGHIVESTVIMNTLKNPNFDQPLFFFDVVSVSFKVLYVTQSVINRQKETNIRKKESSSKLVSKDSFETVVF